MFAWVAAHALAIALFAILCYGTGRALIARLPCEDALLRAAIATGLGFCVFAQVLFVVASLGVLTPTVVFAILALMALTFLWSGGRSRPPAAEAAAATRGVALSFLAGDDSVRALLPESAEAVRALASETLHIPLSVAIANARLAAIDRILDRDAARHTNVRGVRAAQKPRRRELGRHGRIVQNALCMSGWQC